MSDGELRHRRGQQVDPHAIIPPPVARPTMPWGSEVACDPRTDGLGEMQRTIGPILKRLYPQNPDIVLGREALVIAEALIADGWTRHAEGR